MIGSQRAAYAALALLTLLWGSNWAVLKYALGHADPIVHNIHRTWLAIVILFAALAWRRGIALPASWVAVLVTGFFQTTVNFGSTTMAVAGGGIGRTSVLVFTMPFWTLLLAWPVLHERVRGALWVAVACAFAGLTLIVAPWDWEGALAPKLWAVLSGFGWAAGTVCTKYFQRRHDLDMLNFTAWQMLVGVLPLTLLPLVLDLPPTDWGAAYALQLLYVGGVSTAFGFLLWIGILRWLPAGTTSLSTFAIPVIALVSAMLLFDERLARNEWVGIALIGAGLAMLAARALRSGRNDGRADVDPPPAT